MKEFNSGEQQLRPENVVSADSPICNHHWIIEPPSGPTSPGQCKNCGEQRLFLNSNEFTSYREYVDAQDRLGLIKYQDQQGQMQSEIMESARNFE